MKRAGVANGKVGAKNKDSFATVVGRALRRSARAARKVARVHGTPIYIWKNDKVVAIKPFDADERVFGTAAEFWLNLQSD